MNELIDFFVSFFNNLGSNIKRDENFLVVENISPKFEKFSGKKGPYLFSFEKEKEGYELITQNNYLVNTIKDFLEGRGESTLLKIVFDKEIKENINKIIPFRNSKIKNIIKTAKNEFIFKFSFSTNYRYLNEKESVVNSIFVKENKIINLDEKFKLVEGSKGEINERNIEKEYLLAKEKLKEINREKIKELGEKLNALLTQEITRIDLHYENNLREFREQETSLLKQAETSKLDKEKLKKIEKNLVNLREGENVKKIQDEQKALIQSEIKKHGLKIDNKLINTSIIYYPIYTLNLTLELEDKNYKIIELIYDPLNEKIEPLYCKSCKKELKEIILCSSGHLTCRECGEKCVVCGSTSCKQCNIERCSVCGVNTCPQCVKRCGICNKPVCNSHINLVQGRKICNNCAKKESANASKNQVFRLR